MEVGSAVADSAKTTFKQSEGMARDGHNGRPDAESMETHMAIVRERAQEAYAETLDATVRIQVFGRLDALRQQAGSGVDISVNGEHLGGFLARPPSAEPLGAFVVGRR